MELTVLNENFQAVKILDNFESMIWTDRYYEAGDFEIHTPYNREILNDVKKGFYLVNSESEHTMIVEGITITTDVESGNYVTITGRSLESILDRRIVWGMKTLNGNFQNGIKTLLDESIISPVTQSRKIPNFIFKRSEDSRITSLTIEAQYTGDYIYDIVRTSCEERNIGFKITLEDGMFVFELYCGTDRSYDQVENPYVVFSPNFENLLNSEYLESDVPYKTASLIGGEGEGASRRYVSIGGGTGLDRRELFIDARNIKSTTEDGSVLPLADYQKILIQKGREEMATCTKLKAFEGEIETTQIFVYNRDFMVGDIVQLENEYGNESKVRILEVVTNEDAGGLFVSPTFKSIDQ